MQQNDDKILRQIGTRIKDLRVQNQKSLNQFAYASEDLTSATLSRIENGLVDFKFTTLVKIARALNMNLSDLFENFPVE